MVVQQMPKKIQYMCICTTSKPWKNLIDKPVFLCTQLQRSQVNEKQVIHILLSKTMCSRIQYNNVIKVIISREILHKKPKPKPLLCNLIKAFAWCTVECCHVLQTCKFDAKFSVSYLVLYLLCFSPLVSRSREENIITLVTIWLGSADGCYRISGTLSPVSGILLLPSPG